MFYNGARNLFHYQYQLLESSSFIQENKFIQPRILQLKQLLSFYLQHILWVKKLTRLLSLNTANLLGLKLSYLAYFLVEQAYSSFSIITWLGAKLPHSTYFSSEKTYCYPDSTDEVLSNSSNDLESLRIISLTKTIHVWTCRRYLPWCNRDSNPGSADFVRICSWLDR